MTTINETIFTSFCLLSQKVKSLKESIHHEEMNEQNRWILHKELESVQDKLATLRANALQTHHQTADQFAQLEEMDRQIITLYRIIEERFEKHEILFISQKALELTTANSNKFLKMTKKVDELKSSIQFLFKHRAPSFRHRKIVDLALKIATQAERKGSTEQKQMMNLLKTLLNEALQKAEASVDLEEGTMAAELHEVADLIEGNKNEGKLRLNLLRSKLSYSQRKRLEIFSDSPVIIREIAAGNDCIDWEVDLSSKVVSLHA